MKTSFNKKSKLSSKEIILINELTKLLKDEKFLNELKISERHKKILQYKLIENLSDDEIKTNFETNETAVQNIYSNALRASINSIRDCVLEVREVRKTNETYRATIQNIRESLNAPTKLKQINKENNITYPKPTTEEELISIEVHTLPISNRTKNCLYSGDFYNLKDVLSLSKSELFRFRNFGTNSMQDLIEALAKYGLKLKDN